MTRMTTERTPGRACPQALGPKGRRAEIDGPPLVLLGPGGRFVGEYRDAGFPPAVPGPAERGGSLGGVVVTVRRVGASLGLTTGRGASLGMVRRDALPAAQPAADRAPADPRASLLGLIVACERHLMAQEEAAA